ncbi:MAG TPA: hypothetical protein VJS64_18050 [Pyrinomonadaceae bacterium]|nr:hypothetical protein [Pyrinomonadaceae bacterium]
MRKTKTYRFVRLPFAFMFLCSLWVSGLQAQSKSVPPGKSGQADKSVPLSKSAPPGKEGAARNVKTRSIPFVVVRPLPSLTDFPGYTGGLEGRGFRRTAPPGALSSDARSRMLRDAGYDFAPPSMPREIRLSPSNPIVSSSAYLFFSGKAEFNAVSDTLFMDVPQSVIPGFSFPGSPQWGEASGGPQPDPPGIVGVLLRMEPRSRYLADFSASSEQAQAYYVTVTGVEGSGRFERGSGAQHVLAVLESNAGGYVRIGFFGYKAFSFHNVVVTKLD